MEIHLDNEQKRSRTFGYTLDVRTSLYHCDLSSSASISDFCRNLSFDQASITRSFAGSMHATRRLVLSAGPETVHAESAVILYVWCNTQFKHR